MNAKSSTGFVHWAPRVLGIVFTLFISLFALDAFEVEGSVFVKIGAFLIHLIPTFIVGLGVILSWRRPWIGALIFLGFAAWYIFATILIYPSYALIIGGPPTLTGGLFLADWLRQRKAQPAAPPAP